MTLKAQAARTDRVRALVEHLGGQEEAAQKLNRHQTTVSGWCTGKHEMSLEAALLAEKLTDGAFKAAELCEAAERIA